MMILNYRLHRLYRMTLHNYKDASVQMTQILSLSNDIKLQIIQIVQNDAT